MKKNILILDIDGVLITTPQWKADEIDVDGYSKFNTICVNNLNNLLKLTDFEIWLSSTRRVKKTIEEFNTIFSNRNIEQPIIGYLPQWENCKNRKEEIIRFIDEFKIANYLIIDDDKSLNGLDKEMKKNLVLTELMKGFTSEKLEEASQKIK